MRVPSTFALRFPVHGSRFTTVPDDRSDPSNPTDPQQTEGAEPDEEGNREILEPIRIVERELTKPDGTSRIIAAGQTWIEH